MLSVRISSSRSVVAATSRSLSLLLLVAAATTGLVFVAAPAQAAAPLSCLNALYIADQTSGEVRIVNPATGTVGAAAYDGTPEGGSTNQIGVSLAGARGIGTDGTDIVEYTAASGTTTTTPKLTQSGVNGVAGAVDPKSGLFYYGGYDDDDVTLVLWVYNPATNTSTGPVASISAASSPGGNGDIAFDADGILYFVGSSDTVTALFRLNVALPSSGPQQNYTATEITRTSGLPGNTNGIAFASDGYLYLGRSNALTQINPISGATVDSVPMAGVASADLASCAGPSTLSVAVDLPAGRTSPTDQFTVTVSGPHYDGTPAFPVGTTTGSETGVQNQQPGEVAGKAIVLPGDTYSATLGASGTTNLNEYLIGYSCVDTSTGQVTETGTGTSMPVTVPTGTTGATTACSFVVDVPAPEITLVASVSPTSFTQVGQTLTYTYEVENTGNVPLTDFALTNTLSGLSTPSCSPVAEGGTLAVGAVTTCTATYVVTAADSAAGADLTDNPSVTGNPPPDKGAAPTANDSATSVYALTRPDANNDAAGTPYDTPVTLPGATDDTAGSSPIVAADTVLLDPDDGGGVTTLVTVSGAWTVNPSGTVTFVPAPGFVGTTPFVTYRIVDENGLTHTAILNVTVQQGPTADTDSATTPQDVDVDVDLLDGDFPGPRANGTAGDFDTTSVELVLTGGLPVGSTLSPNGRILTVPGEGVHTVDPATGMVSFDPETAFVGTTSPVTYTVLDQANNQASSTYTVTVTAITPVATDDGAKTASGDPVTVDVLANDTAGHPSAPLVASSVVLTDPDATLGGTRLVVPGEGEWVVNLTGTVTFTTEAGFDGATSPVEYRVSDDNGETATATITVVVGEDALAVADVGSTPQDIDVTVDPLTNDIPGDQGTPCTPPGSSTPPGCDTGTFDPTSVVFGAIGQPFGTTPTNAGKQLVVPNEGTYTVDPGSGAITFDPAPAFRGEASPVFYTVEDSYSNTVSATLTVTVRPISPVATDDARNTAYDTTVTLPATTNDSPGTDDNGTPGDTSDDVTPALVPGATVFPATGQPATPSLDGKELFVPGEGTWVVDPSDGSVLFAPVQGFTGTTSPVTYQIEDENGAVDTATLTVLVRSGPQPQVDTATTTQNVDVTLLPLANDTPGLAADGTTGTWDVSSVVFPAFGQPTGATLSPDGKELGVPGQGTYTIDADGSVTFDPFAAFSGTATPVTYQVTDSLGNVGTAIITVTVTAVTPTALDDSARTPAAEPVVIDVLDNDEAGSETVPLVPATLRLLDPLTDLPVTEIVVSGEGTWTVDAGEVRFAPVDGFEGTATPVDYVVEDMNGTEAQATITVVVGQDAVAVADLRSTPQDIDVTFDPLANDIPGDLGTPCTPPGSNTPAGCDTGTWDTASVVFPLAGQPVGATLSPDGKELLVPGQGTYTIDVDGAVTFDPIPSFSDTATPVTYQVTDSLGNAATATITITVTDVTPTAVDDSARTPAAEPVVIDVLDNDEAGSESAPLVPATLRLLDPLTDLPVTEIVVSGEGTWTVVAGEVRFAPVDGFEGTATPVDYVVEDVNGTEAQATITVVVEAAGWSLPSSVETAQGNPVTVDVLKNVTPAEGETLLPATVCLMPATVLVGGNPRPGAAAADDCVEKYTLPGVGTWVVNPSGTITFRPAAGFSGVATIDFQVQDTGGNTYQDELNVDVQAAQAAPQPAVQTTTPAADLPDTGGPALALLLGGALSLLFGLALVRRFR